MTESPCSVRLVSSLHCKLPVMWDLIPHTECLCTKSTSHKLLWLWVNKQIRQSISHKPQSTGSFAQLWKMWGELWAEKCRHFFYFGWCNSLHFILHWQPPHHLPTPNSFPTTAWVSTTDIQKWRISQQLPVSQYDLRTVYRWGTLCSQPCGGGNRPWLNNSSCITNQDMTEAETDTLILPSVV